jgi:hypothetical protein
LLAFVGCDPAAPPQANTRETPPPPPPPPPGLVAEAGPPPHDLSDRTEPAFASEAGESPQGSTARGVAAAAAPRQEAVRGLDNLPAQIEAYGREAAKKLPVVTADAALPGEWKELAGGFEIKWPPNVPIQRDVVDRDGNGMSHHVSGWNQDHVNFGVMVRISPSNRSGAMGGLNPAYVVLASRDGGPVRGPANAAEIFWLNDLLVSAETTISSQPAPITKQVVRLRGTVYQFNEGEYQVHASMNTRADADPALHAALVPYLQTLRRARPQ